MAKNPNDWPVGWEGGGVYTWLGRRRSGDVWARGGRYNAQRDSFRCGGASLQACVLVLLFAAAVEQERPRCPSCRRWHRRPTSWCHDSQAPDVMIGGWRYY